MTTIDVTPYTTLQAFVHLGFQEDASLDFRVTLPRDKTEAVKVVNAVGCYNTFDPEAVWAIIDGWWECLMAVDLAREGSPAVYFRFPFAERQLLDNTQAAENLPYSWGRDPVDAEKCLDWAARLSCDLLEERADEISYDRETRVLRAWWD